MSSVELSAFSQTKYKTENKLGDKNILQEGTIHLKRRRNEQLHHQICYSCSLFSCDLHNLYDPTLTESP